MIIHCLQHVPFEHPGYVADWASAREHSMRVIKLYQDEPLPSPDDADLLVVMGGPMSVHDESVYPWLGSEKRLIENRLAKGKFTLGICLGSQLVAEALGATVYRNHCKEIGWFPVTVNRHAGTSDLFAQLPPQFTPFHWHGETYDLPAGTIHLASSEACAIQAFEHPSALGIQFHLEITPTGVADLVSACASDIGSGPYEQPVSQLPGSASRYEENHAWFAMILDGIANRVTANAR